MMQYKWFWIGMVVMILGMILTFNVSTAGPASVCVFAVGMWTALISAVLGK